MRRKLLLSGAAGLVALGVAGAGAYVYFFSSLRSSPPSLRLSSSPSTASATASTGLVGTWTVTTGSVARYRVKELFAGETAKHDAVAQTSNVTGTLSVGGDSSGYQASGITVTADLSSLHSIDTVAGRNVSQRDGIVSRQLDVQQFPTAKFSATTALVPAGVTSGKANITVSGALTIHGVTKDVTVTGQAQVVGDKIEVAGSVAINMTDYGVSPPQVPFTAVDPTATIEFDLFLTKS